MNKLFIYTSFKMYQAKEKVKDFWKEEKGGSEIIAVIVLVAIVILLAVFFREKLGKLVSDIWGAIDGKTGEITGEFTG